MKPLLTISLFLISLVALAQESAESIEISIADVQNANVRVTKELEKLNKQLRKKLGKAYPDFTVDQLDSLIEVSVEQGKEKTKETGFNDKLSENQLIGRFSQLITHHSQPLEAYG